MIFNAFENRFRAGLV